MRYRTHRDIRQGDTVLIPGRDGKFVVVYFSKRRYLTNELTLSITIVAEADVIAGVQNPVTERIYLGSGPDDAYVISLHDIQQVSRGNLRKEENVKYTFDS